MRWLLEMPYAAEISAIVAKPHGLIAKYISVRSA
jgi:hypothetical protein